MQKIKQVKEKNRKMKLGPSHVHFVNMKYIYEVYSYNRWQMVCWARKKQHGVQKEATFSEKTQEKASFTHFD
jgi:hypothetical protein